MSDKLEMPLEQFAEAVAKENVRLNEHNEKLKEQINLYFHAFNKAADRIEKLEETLKPFADLAYEIDGEMYERLAHNLEDGAFIKACKALEGNPKKSAYKEGYRAVEEAMGHPSPEFWVERKYD